MVNGDEPSRFKWPDTHTGYATGALVGFDGSACDQPTLAEGQMQSTGYAPHGRTENRTSSNAAQCLGTWRLDHPV
jgi:hypothetical protein